MNLQVVIELLLKNKKAVQEVLEQLNKQCNLDIDTSDLDAAMSELSDHDVVISADASQAEEAAETAEAEIEEIPEEHETEITAEDNSTSVITAISTGYMALMQVIGQVKGKIDELVNLSGEQEKAENLLQVSLKNTGDATQATFEKFKDLAGSYQNLTTIGDETTMGIMHLGLNMGVMTEDLEEATKGAIGLSKSLGLDLKTAMKMHTLAMDKDFTMLQRYLPALKTAKTESEKMAIVKRAEANGWKLATSEVDKGYGSLEQYGNTLGDVKEKIGDLVMSAMKPLMSVTHEWLTALDDALKKPLSDKIRDEQIEFNSLVGILKDVNSLQATRNMAIAELQEKYPDFIGNIDLEKASVAELEIALKSANDEFQRKIDMQVAEEVLADKRKDLAKVTKDLFYSEKSLHEQQQKGVEQNVSSLLAYRNTEEAIERERNKVNELTAELGDLETELKRQGLVTDESTEKTNKQTEGVKKLSDELQALADKIPKIKIEMDVDDLTGGDDDEAFLAEMEREREHLEEIIGLKIDFYEREDELTLTAYERQMNAIDDFYTYNKDKLIESGLTEEQIVLQTEMSKDRIRKQYAMRAVSGTSQMFGNLAKIMRAQGKSGFTAWKRMAQSQALIDTYKAAQSAYASMAGIPIVGPVLGALAAGAALAAGYENVRAIERQKFAGGGVVPEETDITVGEEGPEAIVPLPDGKSIPVKNMGGDSKLLSAILLQLKAMNINIVRQSKNITFVIETTDPEATVNLLNDTGDRMTEANDVG